MRKIKVSFESKKILFFQWTSNFDLSVLLKNSEKKNDNLIQINNNMKLKQIKKVIIKLGQF